MRVLRVFVVLLLCASTAAAQPYYFRHYQVEEGLSNNSIFTCVQDKNGFVWFGTKDGLNRFDGYRFKVFHIPARDENAVSRDQITALATDHTGTLWVGSQKGLYRFEPDQERLVPFIDSLADIYDICFDRSGRLWFTSGVTANSFDFKQKTLTRFPTEHFFTATALCELDGKMWFSGTDGFIRRLDPATNRFESFPVFSHSPPSESQWVEKIMADDQGSIYIGTSGQGIKRFDTATRSYTDLLMYNAEINRFGSTSITEF